MRSTSPEIRDLWYNRAMKQIKFHLAMAGYTYNKFSIDQTLKELEKFDVYILYWC